MPSKVAADETYLTTALSNAERNRIIRGNPAALERMRLHNMDIDRMIRQILDLHFDRKLNTEQIVELFVEYSPPGTEKDIKRKISG